MTIYKKKYHIFNVYSTENDGSTSFYKIELLRLNYLKYSSDSI